MTETPIRGPLHGIRIVEIAGIGPGPFCGMMLADMGAEVIRVQRPDADPTEHIDPMCRSRRSLVCDLKQPGAAEVVLKLAESADGLFEGFRPGVAERLGIGPDHCLARNPKLVYGRITGWGQDGPLAQAAGHDLNYIALTGALHAIGRAGQKPVPPLNLVGDFGGGGMLLAFGMVCALLDVRAGGDGQVVDAAMVDGANLLIGPFRRFMELGLWQDRTGSNFLSGAAHFYDTYETRDGGFISIAALEPSFYELLIEKLSLDPERFGPAGFFSAPGDAANWSELKRELDALFRTRTRDEWCQLLEGSDVCFAPVLTLSEAPSHPHAQARDAFVEVGGQLQPRPAPRFSRTPTADPAPAAQPGCDTRALLEEAGYAEAAIERMLADGVVREGGGPLK